MPETRSTRFDVRGINHLALVVNDMAETMHFYTEVLGGTEVMRDGDFKGEPVHYTLMADQELYNDAKRFDECMTEYAALSKKVPALEQEWLELTEKLEEAANA